MLSTLTSVSCCSCRIYTRQEHAHTLNVAVLRELELALQLLDQKHCPLGDGRSPQRVLGPLRLNENHSRRLLGSPRSHCGGNENLYQLMFSRMMRKIEFRGEYAIGIGSTYNRESE